MEHGKNKDTSKFVDSKGRVALGSEFAGRPVIFRRVSNTTVTISLARIIPEDEAWLYEDKKALASVRRGLTQAKAGVFSKRPPDLDADAETANTIPDP